MHSFILVAAPICRVPLYKCVLLSWSQHHFCRVPLYKCILLRLFPLDTLVTQVRLVQFAGYSFFRYVRRSSINKRDAISQNFLDTCPGANFEDYRQIRNNTSVPNLQLLPNCQAPDPPSSVRQKKALKTPLRHVFIPNHKNIHPRI